ncbi:MAG: DUF1573 domain-containing protein [Bacteroidetes bacterium]|jgi:hypothetical protein|nr:DUF1573 domain-containing protein [Bacteroidota bacterium]MBT6687371.1 DUF1573 domain-containing protein [Bacteroidota bacterium]MBT7143922.1 DUF1573 domain-containing protein [Bacteroidota bacterium]MBT7492426.1 DUF1573 domain-containing protein [Bacteroidota bacterium]
MLKNNIIKGLLIVLIVSSISCNSESTKDNTDSSVPKISTEVINNPISASGDSVKDILPKFKFENEEHDFGLIIQGEKVSYTFNFTNIGGSDLVISSAKATCGCTVPKFNKKPIPPGGKGTIEVVFDSGKRRGRQNKTISVLANTQPNRIKLAILADIYVPK